MKRLLPCLLGAAALILVSLTPSSASAGVRVGIGGWGGWGWGPRLRHLCRAALRLLSLPALLLRRVYPRAQLTKTFVPASL